jgi:transcriptional regulator with XRE-family HTH domain
MPSTSPLISVVDQQLLLQLGQRLKRIRVRQGLTTVQTAENAGLSRMTLRAIEAGEPTPSIGSYLRVMRALGVSQDLALLATDAVEYPRQARDAVARAESAAATVSNARHELQDLQSLALHQEAVRRMKQDPHLINEAMDTLNRWRSEGGSRTELLWDEWAVILQKRAWRRALTHTQRARELRQASPLATVLPKEARQQILKEVRRIKAGDTSQSP